MNVEKVMEQQVAEDVSVSFGEQELGKRAEVGVCEVSGSLVPLRYLLTGSVANIDGTLCLRRQTKQNKQKPIKRHLTCIAGS